MVRHNHRLEMESFNYLFLYYGKRLHCARCGLKSTAGGIFAKNACIAPSPTATTVESEDPTNQPPQHIYSPLTAQSEVPAAPRDTLIPPPPLVVQPLELVAQLGNRPLVAGASWEEDLAALQASLKSTTSDPVERYVSLINSTQVGTHSSPLSPGLCLDFDARECDGTLQGYVCVYRSFDKVFEMRQHPSEVKQFYFMFCLLGRDLLATCQFFEHNHAYFGNPEISPEYRGPDDS